MSSSNRPLSDFLMENDFIQLKEDARRKKREAQLQALKDAQAQEEEAKRKAAEKAITAEDVKLAEKRGYDRGFEDAKNDTRQKMTEEFKMHLNALESQLNSHEDIARKYSALLMQSSTEMARAVLEYIVDDIATRYPQEMLKKALERGLERVNKEAELVIFVNPASQVYMADISKEFLKKRDYKLQDDPTLPMGACRIEWQGNGHESSIEGLHTDMQELIDGFRQGIHPNKVELPPLELEEDEEASEKNPAEPQDAKDASAETETPVEAAAQETAVQEEVQQKEQQEEQQTETPQA